MASAGVAMADPDPTQVYIQRIDYAGTGCPAGSVSGNIALDAKAFTLLFDNFVADAGPHIPLTEARKNCQLNIQLHVPQGWSYAIATVDYRGYMLLDPSVTATQRSTYYYAGSLQQASAQSTWAGPQDQDYVVRDTLGLASLVWSPCGAQRNLNINAEVRVNNRITPGSSGMLTVDSIDGKVEQIYGFLWRRCQ
jgi:hypothetical protein